MRLGEFLSVCTVIVAAFSSGLCQPPELRDEVLKEVSGILVNDELEIGRSLAAKNILLQWPMKLVEDLKKSCLRLMILSDNGIEVLRCLAHILVQFSNAAGFHERRYYADAFKAHPDSSFQGWVLSAKHRITFWDYFVQNILSLPPNCIMSHLLKHDDGAFVTLLLNNRFSSQQLYDGSVANRRIENALGPIMDHCNIYKGKLQLSSSSWEHNFQLRHDHYASINHQAITIERESIVIFHLKLDQLPRLLLPLKNDNISVSILEYNAIKHAWEVQTEKSSTLRDVGRVDLPRTEDTYRIIVIMDCNCMLAIGEHGRLFLL